MRGSSNKSPTKLNVVENKFNTGDLFTNGENYQNKTPPGEFKVTTTKKMNPNTLYQLTVERLPQYLIGLVL